MATLKHLNPDCSTDEILDVLDEDAGLIIDNLIDKDQINKINADLDPYLKLMFLAETILQDLKQKELGL